MAYVIAYDVGTTGVKTSLFNIDKKIEMVAGAIRGYNLYILDGGGAEQDVDEWWEAMRESTAELFTKTDVKPDQIAGISFCTQAQGLVLVDKDGKAVRRAMSYMDQRAKDQIAKYMQYGIKVAGCNVFKLPKWLYLTCAASTSVKDPLWKYKWVEEHEPEVFKDVYKWFDVKEYLLCRCTGKFVMTYDSAYATFLYDTRKGHEGWSKSLCKSFGVNMEHLPPLVKTTDNVGGLTEKAASELGLKAGTPVFGGGMDATLVGVGAGATSVGDTHIYCGTSGWVNTVTDKQTVDIDSMIAATVGAETGLFNYFAEMETAGKSLEWVKNHLALDEISIYSKRTTVEEDIESKYTNLYEYLSDIIATIPAGSNGVIFTPWLHGNRCPFEDPLSKGMFFNIGIETGKTEMIRAVIEGISFHLRWMIEAEDKKVKTSNTIRFVGGGALQPLSCQILADITGKTIETIDNPQNVGAVGAAAVVGVGLGIIESFEKLKEFVPATATYIPNKANKEVYDRNFEVFKKLYKSNKENFRLLNQ